MLGVKKTEKKRRVSETHFEEQFAEALGLASWHMLNREAGWPDRYLGGGRWVELKVLDRFGKDDGSFPEQRARMTALHNSGDAVFYCARCNDKFILERWI